MAKRVKVTLRFPHGEKELWANDTEITGLVSHKTRWMRPDGVVESKDGWQVTQAITGCRVTPFYLKSQEGANGFAQAVAGLWDWTQPLTSEEDLLSLREEVRNAWGKEFNKDWERVASQRLAKQTKDSTGS